MSEDKGFMKRTRRWVIAAVACASSRVCHAVSGLVFQHCPHVALERDAAKSP
jgi:hypothetical protein